FVTGENRPGGMGPLDSDNHKRSIARGGRSNIVSMRKVSSKCFQLRATLLVGFLLLLLLVYVPLPILSQSGRQKDPKLSNANKTHRSTSPIADPSNKNSDEVEEVLRVTSNLVPVPATVVD